MRIKSKGGIDKRIRRTLRQIVKGYHPERVYLFGSAARGDDDEYSDLDFAVIAKSSLKFIDRLLESIKFVDDTRSDILVYTPAEFEEMVAKGNDFAANILKGRLLYEKQRHGPIAQVVRAAIRQVDGLKIKMGL